MEIDDRSSTDQQKTAERAIGLVSQLSGVQSRIAARSRLERADWNLREALKEE